MAGTEAYQLRGDFDPRTMTLEEYISLYEKESTEVGGRSNQTWGNKFRKNPVYKKYLNEPVIALFDGKLKIDGKNLQAAAEEAEGTLPQGGSPNTLQSKLRVLEEGVFARIKDIDASEGTNLQSGVRKLSEQVKKLATRGAAKTATVQYNINKMGDLVENLVAHVDKFPDDKPVANAILLLAEMGSRPSLPSELTSAHYVKATATPEALLLGSSGADGLLIQAGTKGTKRQAKGQTPNIQPYNAPLSQRAITILQDQSEYNRVTFGDNRLANFFQIKGEDGKPRTLDLDKDINKLLEKVSPKGILQDITQDGVKPSNKPLKSSDFRKIYHTTGEAAGIERQKIAALVSRDTAVNTGSTGVYIGQAGEYNPAAVADQNQISKRIWGQFALKTKAAKDIFKESNQMLATSTLVFGDNTPDRVKTNVFEVFGTGKPGGLKIQTGGFSAPVDEPAETNTSSKLQSDDKAMSQGKGDLSSSLTPDETKQLEGLGIKKFLSLLPLAGAAYVAPDSYREAKKRVEEITGPGILPEIAGGAAFASEFTEIGAYSDMVDREGALPRILAAEQANIDELRQRGRDRVATKMMEQEAMQDSAMRLKPEAGRDFIPAPEVEEDNFLTMQP